MSDSSPLKGHTSNLLRKTANKQKTKTGTINTPASRDGLDMSFSALNYLPSSHTLLFHHFKIILTTFHIFSTTLNAFMFNVFLNTTRFVLNLIPSELQHKQDSALRLKFQSPSRGTPQCQLASCSLSPGTETCSPSQPTLSGSQNIADSASRHTGGHLLFADLFLVWRIRVAFKTGAMSHLPAFSSW